MQTTGTVLLAVNRSSSARVRMLAQDSRSVYRLLTSLLYVAIGASMKIFGVGGPGNAVNIGRFLGAARSTKSARPSVGLSICL